jgi:hypothetical protein
MDRMTIRHLLPVVIAAMLGWSAAASAQAPGFNVSTQYLINPDGTGSLFASPNGGGSVNWEACPPGEACAAVASRPDRAPSPTLGGAVDVGNAAVGTVFVATATNGSQTTSVSSVPYLGPVRSTTPPTIRGKLRVGALIKPQAGTWGGGWGSDHSYLQTQVCRFANGTGCVVVADPLGWAKCPGAGAVLTFNQAGRYVRVIDWRIGRDAAFALVGVPSPDRIEPLHPGPALAATIAGPIAPASGPPESTCGQPPPKVTLPARAIRRRDRLELGTVTCVMRCRVRVYLKQKGRRGISFKRSFTVGAAPHRLLLPVKVTRRMKPGATNVSVFLGADLISEGRVAIPGL